MMTCLRHGVLLAAVWLAMPAAHAAEQIVGSNYTVAANGMPYGIAMEKNFFRQESADISGILSSAGGGSTVRTMLGGDLADGEIDWSKIVDTSFLPDDLNSRK